MKITIDTELKTIKIDSNTKIGKIIQELDKMLGDEWMEYTIEANTTSYTYPIWWYPTTPYQPWIADPQITWHDTNQCIYTNNESIENQIHKKIIY